MKKLLAITTAAALSCTLVCAAENFDKAVAIKKIDKLVQAGLDKNRMTRGAAIDDTVFVRRAYLDIIGRIPTIEESENFLGSTYERKREQLIADLLDSDGHVSHAYNFWADVLRINNALGGNSGQAEAAYQLWLKKAIEENRPYDQVVREMVASTGKIWENGAVGYYIRDRGMPLDNMSNTVRVFLGTRLECAQCHNHPFDKWTQMDYYKMAAFSYGMDARSYNSRNRVAYSDHQRGERKKIQDDLLIKAGYETKGFPSIPDQRSLDKFTQSNKYEKYLTSLKMTDKEFRDLANKSIEAMGDFSEKGKAAQYALGRVYQQLQYFSTEENAKTVKLPHDYQYSDAKPLSPVKADTMFGADIDLANVDDSAVQAYAKWMTSKDNPTFTKVIANRLWKKVFGHGVYEPVDELTDHTYVANPELLSYLEEIMRSLNYDMRAYMDVLYNTRTYQSASYNGEMVMGAPYHFPGPVFRRLTAEQIWDSIVALALPEADSYRPRIKTQLASVEKYRQMYLTLEEKPEKEYIAMVEALGEAVSDLMPKQEKIRQEMYAARDAKDEVKMAQLRKELGQLSQIERKTIEDIAFKHVGDKVDADTLLTAVGMSEMQMTDDSGMAKEDNVVLTKLPKVDMKTEAPVGLDKNQKKEWYNQQRNHYRNYTSLVSTMARASELQSPAPAGHFLREFGQSDREVIENAGDGASVPQALNLLNGTIVEALINEYAVFGSRIHSAGDVREKTRMIFQAMLTREPTEKEFEMVQAEVDVKGEKAYEGIVWALLNTQQFIFVQ